MRRKGTFHILASTLAAALLLLVDVPLASAGGVVTNCGNDADFASKLAGGGAVTFDCGTATISLSSTKTITTSTTIDGGGKITLNGAGQRLFIVNSGATLTLQNIVLTGGYGPPDPGGAISNAGHLVLSNTTVQNSTNSNYSGGAIATTGPLIITNSTLVHNIAGNGGAIFATGAAAKVTINQSTLYDNTASSSLPNSARGGAIYLLSGANATISASNIYSNTAKDGGAVASFSSTVSLVGSTLANNLASVRGPALMDDQGTISVGSSTVQGNRGGLGGGIWNNGGTLAIRDSTFTDNHQQTPGYGGGGLTSRGGATTVASTTFFSNTAGGGGAAIENAFNSVMTLSNVTISGNTAGNYGGQGGGIYNYKATLMMTNVTLDGNSSPTGAGGGIYNDNSPETALSMRNVIVADSPKGGNCGFGKLPETSLFNLSSDATCAFGSGRDSVDVKLGPLMNNAGLTLTHLPQTDSPAIDSGTAASCPLIDQRGVRRFVGATCDVGAVEVGAKPSLTSISPTSASVDGPPFDLTVTGSGFLANATAVFNSIPLTTTFVSSTVLTATVPTSALAAGGTITVSVRHGDVPAETSNALPFTINKLDQTITFGPIPGRTFGDQPFTIAATASSGLSVAFSASGNCTVSGATVTLTNGGSCTILASQAGDARYNPAPNVSQSFTIAASGPTSTPTPTATPTPIGTPAATGTPIATGTPGATATPTSIAGSSPSANALFIAVVLSGSEPGW